MDLTFKISYKKPFFLTEMETKKIFWNSAIEVNSKLDFIKDIVSKNSLLIAIFHLQGRNETN